MGELSYTFLRHYPFRSDGKFFPPPSYTIIPLDQMRGAFLFLLTLLSLSFRKEYPLTPLHHYPLRSGRKDTHRLNHIQIDQKEELALVPIFQVIPLTQE